MKDEEIHIAPADQVLKAVFTSTGTIIVIHEARCRRVFNALVAGAVSVVSECTHIYLFSKVQGQKKM